MKDIEKNKSNFEKYLNECKETNKNVKQIQHS